MSEAEIIINGKTEWIGNYPNAHLNPANEGGVVVIDKVPRFKIEDGKQRRLAHEEVRAVCGPPTMKDKWSLADFPNSGIIRQGFVDTETGDVLRAVSEKRYEHQSADFYQGGKLMGTISDNAMTWTPEAVEQRERAAVTARIVEITKFCEELESQSFLPNQGVNVLPNGLETWNYAHSATLVAATFGGVTAGYDTENNQEAKIGNREGGAEFALVGMDDGDKNGRFVVDWRSKFYHDTKTFVLDRENPEDKKLIGELYGEEWRWLRSPVADVVMSVYQVKNTRDAGFIPLTEFDPAKFVKVAQVVGSDLEFAFAITNNGSPYSRDKPWTQIKDARLTIVPVSVEDRAAGLFARSTSMGDVVLVHQQDKEKDGLSYACAGVGWQIIPSKEVAEVKALWAAHDAKEIEQYLPVVEPPTEPTEQAHL